MCVQPSHDKPGLDEKERRGLRLYRSVPSRIIDWPFVEMRLPVEDRINRALEREVRAGMAVDHR